MNHLCVRRFLCACACSPSLPNAPLPSRFSLTQLHSSGNAALAVDRTYVAFSSYLTSPPPLPNASSGLQSFTALAMREITAVK